MNEIELIKRAILNGEIDLAVRGFIRIHRGRLLHIYHISDDGVIFIDGEMSGVPQYDFFIFAEAAHVKYIYNPLTGSYKELTAEQKMELQSKLAVWLDTEGIRHDIKLNN